MTGILIQPGIVSCFILEPDGTGRFGGEVRRGERGLEEASFSEDSKLTSIMELSGTAKSETVGELGKPFPEIPFGNMHQSRRKMHGCPNAPGPRSLKQLGNGVGLWPTKMRMRISPLSEVTYVVGELWVEFTPSSFFAWRGGG